MFERRFHSLDCLVDEVHAIFDGWLDDLPFAGLDEFGLLVMKLAVHEWIANLVQHAAFPEETPEILFAVREEEEGLHCVIEDNSAGFDFAQQVDRQATLARNAEGAERGRGLLMMIACTESLAYSLAEHGLHRLEFVLRNPVEPESMAALFPAVSAPPR